MPRPVVGARLLMAAFALIAGEAAGFALQAGAALWPWLAALAAVGALAAYGWGVLRRLALPLVFLAGGALGARAEEGRRRLLEARRYVSAPAPMAVRVESEVRACRARKRAGWMVDFLSHGGALPLKVVLFLPDGARLPAPGETWLCAGRLAGPREGANRPVRHTLWATSGAAARCVQAARATPAARYRRLGVSLARQAALGLDWAPELAGLNRAILLGRRNALSRARRDLFAAAGTIHVFAISGLHVMVVALALGGVLARLGVPLRARGLAALPVVAAYVMVSGARPSAIRAALMLACFMLAPLFGRRPDARTAWALTAFGVYGTSPARVLDLGCGLSFAVMLGIVLWVDWGRGRRPLFPAGTWRGRFAGGLGVSLAAWVAGVPIVAQAFGRVSLGGLVANTVVIFLAGLTVRFGMFGLAASFLCLPLAAIANNLAAACTSAMVKISEMAAALPCAVVETPRWTWGHGVLWYGLWLAAFFLAGRLLPRKAAAVGPWWL